jgi:hypothetical protein
MTSTKQNATQCEPASELAEQPAHRAVQTCISSYQSKWTK